MIPEFGQLALVLALCLACAQSFLGLAGAARRNAGWMATVRSTATGHFVFVGVAFLALAYAFLTNDFSVRYVAENSNTSLPMIYRFAAVWGAHEGSLLLWVLILGVWTVAVAHLSRRLPAEFAARVLGVLGLVSTAFLLYMLFTSDPFTRLLPPAPQGRDLNPILQDPAMAGHPPMLYMGYVGFSVAFAFSVAALIGGKMDAAWARWVRPWTIAAWLFLTLGITLGSWWSYYELGWGGFWAWDPVENASFMPWLAGTALIHSLAVTEKRDAFKSWTALLAIAAFALSLLGTFLVRSGVLISVHSFATDPRRGMFILALIAVVVGGALTLYAWRAPRLAGGRGFKWFSRETFLLLNNIFLAVACAAVLLGTLYPMILAGLGLGTISVGPPYFNAVFLPLIIPFFVLIGIGPYTRWKRDTPANLVPRVRTAAIVSLIAGAVVVGAAFASVQAATIAGVMLAAWTFVSALKDPIARIRRGLSLPRAILGMSLAHFGIGMLLLGVTVSSTLGVTKDRPVKPGGHVKAAGYTFAFKGTHPVQGPNYTAKQAKIVVRKGGDQVTTLAPQKRLYDGGNPTTEAGIDPGLFRDLYVSMGQSLGNGVWSLRVEYKPLVRLIWFGGLVMVLGGILAASDRRYRRVRASERKAVREPSAEGGFAGQA
jgi:cytochrome c-type biogenesis protein CcmF